MDNRHKWERENKVLEEGLGEKLHGLEVDVDFNRTQTPLLTKSQNSKGRRAVKTPATDWEKKTQF